MPPSVPHEALAEVLRDRPDLLVDLLRCAGLRDVPAHDALLVDRTDLGSVLPRELAADALFRFERAGRTDLVVVVEVQRNVDPEKRFSRPTYTDGARLRFRCDVLLLVITPSASVAAWARRPIVFGPGSGHLQPFVIGPEDLPGVDDLERAKAAPEWAVLSALAHARDPDVDRAAQLADVAFQAVFAAIAGDRAQPYFDYLWAALSEAARKALEMRPHNYEYQHEGLRRAKAEGRAEGKAEGKGEGRAESLIDVLTARGFTLTEAQRTASSPRPIRHASAPGSPAPSRRPLSTPSLPTDVGGSRSPGRRASPAPARFAKTHLDAHSPTVFEPPTCLGD